MQTFLRGLVLVALAAALSWFGAVPLCAQMETQPAPPPPSETEPELIAPRPVPLVAPDPDEDRLDKDVVLDGRVRIVPRRFSDFEWRYRIDNGSEETISSFSIVVPDSVYDSRIIPDVPRNWAERREPGQGDWKGRWLISYFALTPRDALKRGKWMEVALSSGAQLLVGNRKGSVLFGTSPSTRLVYPWDSNYFPLRAPFTDGPRRITTTTFDVPYPSLSFLPLPARKTTIPRGLKEQSLDVQTVGQGVHSGRVFQMTVRASGHAVATLERGTVMVPSLKQYDVMMVGRSERLILAPHDIATLQVRGYSISYGRKAPPTRVVLHDLVYDFPPEVTGRQVETYRRILERATRLTPALDTRLGADYYDTVVQWALWRAQRLMEANPLSVRDVERDMAQFFFWRYSLRGPVRAYLQPLEVYQLSKRIWTDTDRLLYEEPPTPPA